MSKLGLTKDGHQIIANACAEENSGIVCHMEQLGKYEVRFSYPVYDLEWPGEAREIVSSTRRRFNDKDAAIAELKNMTGYADYERRGPGF